MGRRSVGFDTTNVTRAKISNEEVINVPPTSLMKYNTETEHPPEKKEWSIAIYCRVKHTPPLAFQFQQNKETEREGERKESLIKILILLSLLF